MFGAETILMDRCADRALFERTVCLINNLDINAGVLVEDSEMNATSEQFFEYMLRVASGEKVAGEKAGFHDMAIFKQGVTL